MGGKKLALGADVVQLLDSIGLGGFPYRELSAQHRREQAVGSTAVAGAALRSSVEALVPLALAELPRPPTHRVVVLSRWRGAGCSMVASHLAQGLRLQGRSVKLVGAEVGATESISRSEELQIVDGSASAEASGDRGESALHAELAARAHTVLAVLSCKEDCAQGLIRLCSVLRDAGAPAPFLVLNRFDARRELDRRIFAALQLHAREALLPWPLHEDPAVALAQARGWSLTHEAPDAQPTWALRQLSAWLAVRHDRGEWLSNTGASRFSAGR